MPNMRNIDILKELVKSYEDSINELRSFMAEMQCVSSKVSDTAIVGMAKRRISDYEFLNKEQNSK